MDSIKLKTPNDVSFRLNKENISDTLFDILASVLTNLANRVSNFKWVNMELQVTKLSKVWSKWKVCISFTNFRCSHVTMTLKLLWCDLKSGQLNQPWLKHNCARTELFFICSHSTTPQWVLIKGLQHFSQDQEVRNGFKTSHKPSKTL